MKKPVLVVDIDDVLAEENLSVMYFMNKHFGLNHTPEDYLVSGEFWGYWDHVMGVDAEEGKRRYRAYLDSGAKAEHPVIQGAVGAISALKQHFDLIIITAREDTTIDLTHDWLERYFPDTFKQVVFAAVWSGDKKASKAAIAKELEASYLIDDNADHCRLASEAGIQALLFGDYGWNRESVMPKDVVRCKDWAAVLEYFNGK